jgi:DnaJ-domain-containing protein 1
MRADPKHLFFLLQIGLGAAFLLAAWLWLRPREPESNFRVRESERRRPRAAGAGEADELARSRMRSKAPLRLTGLRLDVPPHELLGVRADAPAAEIRRAYRDLMKRYHPDHVAAPDTPQWREAQRIADAISRAKEELLRRAGRG